jgi:hypothetical protein
LESLGLLSDAWLACQLASRLEYQSLVSCVKATSSSPPTEHPKKPRVLLTAQLLEPPASLASLVLVEVAAVARLSIQVVHSRETQPLLDSLLTLLSLHNLSVMALVRVGWPQICLQQELMSGKLQVESTVD